MIGGDTRTGSSLLPQAAAGRRAEKAELSVPPELISALPIRLIAGVAARNEVPTVVGEQRPFRLCGWKLRKMEVKLS